MNADQTVLEPADTLPGSVLNTDLAAWIVCNSEKEAAIQEKEEQIQRIRLAIAENDVRHAHEMLAVIDAKREVQDELVRLQREQVRIQYQWEQILTEDSMTLAVIPDDVIFVYVRRAIASVEEEDGAQWTPLLDKLEESHDLTSVEAQEWLNRVERSSASGVRICRVSGATPHDPRANRFCLEPEYRAPADVMNRVIGELAAKEDAIS